ncbi:hypothetical protein NQ317_018491, partial [Molorchus minor]
NFVEDSDNRQTIFLHAQKYIMILVGKWYIGFPNRTVNRIYKTYSLFVEAYFVLMTQQILISAIYYRKCPERTMELICYYIQYSNSNICSLMSKRKTIKAVFNHIIDHERQYISQPRGDIYLKYTKLNLKVVKFFVVLTVIAAVIWYIIAVKNTFSAKIDALCIVKKALNYQIWYPYNLYNNYFWITLLADVLIYICVVSVHIYNKITPVSFLIYILGQVKILQEMIRCIEKDANDIQSRMDNGSHDKAVFVAINKCATKHQEVIRLMTLIDIGCKEIVLISFFTNSLELAAYAIKLLTEEEVFGALRTIAVICTTIAQLFIFFWFANEVKVESAAISDIIYYETDWLNYGNLARRHLSLMMMRSQRPLTISAAAIGDMSLDTFNRVSQYDPSNPCFVIFW